MQAQSDISTARPGAGHAACLMQMTIDTGSITTLRQTVVRVCGDALEFMRIEACEHGARMRVWLCTSEALMAQVMEAVMRFLPGAEFGRCGAAPARRPAAARAA